MTSSAPTTRTPRSSSAGWWPPTGRPRSFTVVQVSSARGSTPGRVPLPGLDPARRYRVRVRPEAGLPETVQVRGPAWFEEALTGGVLVSGAVLTRVGLSLPVLAPAQGFLLQLTAEG